MLYPIDRVRFRTFRISRKVTVKELAEKAGVSRATIVGLESGARNSLREQTFFDLASALGVEPVELEKAVVLRQEKSPDTTGEGDKATST